MVVGDKASGTFLGGLCGKLSFLNILAGADKSGNSGPSRRSLFNHLSNFFEGTAVGNAWGESDDRNIVNLFPCFREWGVESSGCRVRRFSLDLCGGDT